jgi:hypothetical protein
MPVVNNLGPEYDVQIQTKDDKLVIRVTPSPGDLMDDALLQYDKIEETHDSSDETNEGTTNLVDVKNIAHEAQSLSLIYVYGALIVVFLGSFFILRKSKPRVAETTALLEEYVGTNYHTI